MEDVDKQKLFGDYLPKECLAETSSTRTWLAEQESVGRMVLIEELKEEAIEEREAFLEDVRAKAAVEHPLVGSIYEASTDNDRYYFAHELLPGETLKELLESGKKLKAQRFVHVLRRISEANIYHEARNNSTSPLSLDSVLMDPHKVIRIKNLVIAGKRDPEQSPRDVVEIGTSLEELLDRHAPGTTRCLTLLAWMRGQDVAEPLGWEKIRDYCELIEQQLTEPSEVIAPPTAAIRPKKKSGLAWAVAVLLLAAIVAALLLLNKNPSPPAGRNMPDWVTIAAGEYTTPDGEKINISSFEICAYEVTIGEYSEFLETLDLLLDSGSEKAFDHSDQPARKIGHTPDDWSNLVASAKQATPWNGKKIDMNNPVVGVDWWDAYAYAKWKRGFIPTQEQWLGALMSGAKVASAVPVSDWLSAIEETEDRTTNGIHGLAGCVAEWTSEARPLPSNPLGDPQWVIVGGSYLNPGKGAATREWFVDRSARRPDLGFRVCKKIK